MAAEPTLRSLLKTRFRGTLLGCAVGDALGFPFEGSSRSFMIAMGSSVTDRFEKHRSGYFPAGQYSDDTQMTLATVEAILDAGKIDPAAIAAAFVPMWRENRIVGGGATCREAIQRLIDGSADWRSSGAEEGRAGNGAAMRISPIGLWDHDQLEQLPSHVDQVARITHNDPRAIGGAAAVAAAIAYNLTHREIILGDFLDRLVEEVSRHHEGFARDILELPRFLAEKEEVTLEEISRLGTSDPPESREGVTPFVIPSVMTALYYFLRFPQDFVGAVGGCLLAGGDVDTTASLAGSLSGALNGQEAIPRALQEGLQNRGRILDLADRFHSLKNG